MVAEDGDDAISVSNFSNLASSDLTKIQPKTDSISVSDFSELEQQSAGCRSTNSELKEESILLL